MSLVRIEGSTKRRKKPRILTPQEFSLLIVAVDREPCRNMVILALCTGVRCSELAALKWSDFDWQDLSVYIRRAIVSGRLDDVRTEYSEAPLPLDPALAEVIFEWKRKAEFCSNSDFVFVSPFTAGEKPYTPWNVQHNQLSPAAVRAGLGPIGSPQRSEAPAQRSGGGAHHNRDLLKQGRFFIMH
jgi:integrase